MADNTTKIKIKGEDQITPELKKISKSLDDLNKTNLTKLAISFDAVTMAAKTVVNTVSKVATECKKLIDEYSTVERYNNRLISIWDNVGKATGKTAKEMLDFADSIEKVTFYEAESVQTAAQTLAAIQTLNGEGFERAVSLSVDLAEAMGTDVPNAASTLARALAAPEEGLGRLKTIGVTFTEEEKTLISELMNANKEFDAQNIILDKVSDKYKGLAEAVAKTDTNKLTQISNRLGEIRENLGQAILSEVSPVLDFVIRKLGQISDWSKNDADVTSVRSIAAHGGSLSSFSDNSLASALNEIERSPEWGSNAKLNSAWGKINAEINARAMNSARSAAAQSMNYQIDPYAGSYTSVAYTPTRRPGSMTPDEIASIDEKRLEKYKEKVISVSQEIMTVTSSIFSSVTNLITSSLDAQAQALENELATAKEAGTVTIEEEKKKKDEINKLKKKSFEADKANSIASALISGAEAVVKFLADPGGVAGALLSGSAGLTTALQVAAISQQQYTPMATGGIVSSPTHALVGEAGPEAIIPLTKGRNPLESNLQLTININGNAQEEDIYNAIERAQRTGLLPHWSYA